MYNLPILYSNPNGQPDIRIGAIDYTSGLEFPVPLPPELAEEFTALEQVRNVDVYKYDRFRVMDYGEQELFTIDPAGNTRTKGTLQIDGNQIKSSGGTTAIQLSGADTALQGNLQVTGLISSPSGLTTVNNSLTVIGDFVSTGTITGTVKFFDIPHPVRPNHRLRHSALEGPENAVFFRGKTTRDSVYFPYYWYKLVDPESITVHLTPTVNGQTVGVTCNPHGGYFTVENSHPLTPFFYLVMATRIDVDPLEVEYAQA